MATQQAPEAAEAGRLGNDGNAVCCHFFPAGRVALRRAPSRRHGFWQGGQPCRQAVARWTASPQRDAVGRGLRNPG